MKRFKGFLAMLLCIVMTVTLVPAFGETKAKAADLPAALEKAQQVEGNFRLNTEGLYYFGAQNVQLKTLIERLQNNYQSYMPTGTLKAYAIKNDKSEWEDVVFANLSSNVSLIGSGYPTTGYYHDEGKSYDSLVLNYSHITQIALVFGSSTSTTINESDKVIIANVTEVRGPRISCGAYNKSGEDYLVSSVSQPTTDGKKVLDYGIFDDSWNNNSSAYLVFGLAEDRIDNSIAVQVVKGYYESVTDIPSNAEDITSKVWRGYDHTIKPEGILVKATESVPITFIFRRDNKVIDILPRNISLRKEYGSVDDHFSYVYTANNKYLYRTYNGKNTNYNYVIDGKPGRLYTFTLDKDMVETGSYYLMLTARKGRLFSADYPSMVEKIAEGCFSSLEEAKGVTDYKNKLLNENASNGYKIEFNKEYIFTIFYKDGSFNNIAFRLMPPEDVSGPVISKQPVNTTVKENESASFSVIASGTDLKYLWQYKNAGSSTWIDWSSKTTPTISVAYSASRNGMSLRCLITDANGKQVTSDEAILKYTSSKVVAINATNFPDENFRQIISEDFDRNGDGVLSEEEIENVTEVDVEDCEITSLKGIELFPNLINLYACSNEIKSIDISKNAKLCYIEIDSNPISVLDISNCPNLKMAFLNSEALVLGNSYVDYGYYEDYDNDFEIMMPYDITVVLGGTGNAAIVKQPNDYECKQGDKAVFDVGATGKGLKYQWQYKNAGDSSWTTWTSKTNSVISVAYAASRQGMSVRCIVTDANGNKVTSSPAVLTYDIPLTITAEPVSVTVNEGEAAAFSVKAEGTGLKYLWQYKEKGKDFWTDWTSKTTASISVAYLASRNGMSVRCIVTDASGSELISDEAVLTYKSALSITKQPASATVDAGSSASFSVTAAGTGLKYLWQYKYAGDSAWTDWTSKKTASISVAYAAYRDGMSLRCVVTDASGKKVTSNTATLKYNNPLTITKQPASATVDTGSAASFSITATGKGLKYLWQYKYAGDSAWTDWTSKTAASISVAYAAYRDGMSLRCVVTDASGKKVTSNTATLNYNKPLTITKQPANATVDTGSAASFSVTATGKGLKYLWQYKYAGDSAWTDWTSKTTASISVAYAAYRDGMSLRCVVTDASGKKVTSNTATLKYNNPLAITKQPVDVIVDGGTIASFSVKATGSGLKYQWEYKLVGDTNWTTWSAKTKADITVAYAAYRQGMNLRCIVTDASGAQLTTDTVTLSYTE